MGGTFGEIRGTSKIDVYIKYQELVNECSEMSAHPDPKYKKECKRLMIQDHKTGEWVLSYHLHT